jgi:superfamily II DNA/RNA helicase
LSPTRELCQQITVEAERLDRGPVEILNYKTL